MSLLLDALKKASEEKAKKQASSEGVSAPDSNLKQASDVEVQQNNPKDERPVVESEQAVDNALDLSLDDNLEAFDEADNVHADSLETPSSESLAETELTSETVSEEISQNLSISDQSEAYISESAPPKADSNSAPVVRISESIEPSPVSPQATRSASISDALAVRRAKARTWASQMYLHNTGLFSWLTNGWWLVLLSALLLIGCVLLWINKATDVHSRSVALPTIQLESEPILASSTTTVDLAVVNASQPKSMTPVKTAPKSTSKPKKNKRRPKTNTQRTVAAKQLVIEKQPTDSALMAALNAGFSAYQKQSWADAKLYYQRALNVDAENRDARLGMAAIAMRQAQFEQARVIYRNLLQENPTDSAAQSGLLAADEQAIQESTPNAIVRALKNQPQNAALRFTLANEYAKAQQWKKAQEQYFEAFNLQQDSAEYAYNLAVSLDHLGKANAALQFYKKAQVLMQSQPNGINENSLTKRIKQLSHSTTGEPVP